MVASMVASMVDGSFELGSDAEHLSDQSKSYTCNFLSIGLSVPPLWRCRDKYFSKGS